jgi:hypothetical protein
VAICNETTGPPRVPIKDLKRIREYLNEFLEVSQRIAQLSPIELSPELIVEAELSSEPKGVNASEMVVQENHS